MYQQVYRPVYFQLVDVLLHKAQFPSDEEYGFWSSDEKEQFRIYRYSWDVWVCSLGRRGCRQHPASLEPEHHGDTQGGTWRRFLPPRAVLVVVVIWKRAVVLA